MTCYRQAKYYCHKARRKVWFAFRLLMQWWLSIAAKKVSVACNKWGVKTRFHSGDTDDFSPKISRKEKREYQSRVVSGPEAARGQAPPANAMGGVSALAGSALGAASSLVGSFERKAKKNAEQMVKQQMLGDKTATGLGLKGGSKNTMGGITDQQSGLARKINSRSSIGSSRAFSKRSSYMDIVEEMVTKSDPTNLSSAGQRDPFMRPDAMPKNDNIHYIDPVKTDIGMSNSSAESVSTRRKLAEEFDRMIKENGVDNPRGGYDDKLEGRNDSTYHRLGFSYPTTLDGEINIYNKGFILIWWSATWDGPIEGEHKWVFDLPRRAKMFFRRAFIDLEFEKAMYVPTKDQDDETVETLKQKRQDGEPTPPKSEYHDEYGALSPAQEKAGIRPEASTTVSGPLPEAQ